ncbi:hypothetical protein [Streptomyces xinghaiensis]|uniref:hypothetical protein n=1 Tax=Streptomyces xinghaiensis TaxID=1038928 RepID=UPI00341219D7
MRTRALMRGAQRAGRWTRSGFASARAATVIANGFGCKEQIRQGTDRRALHLAEVLALALDRDGNPDRQAPARPRPEELIAPTAASPPARRRADRRGGAGRHRRGPAGPGGARGR